MNQSAGIVDDVFGFLTFLGILILIWFIGVFLFGGLGLIIEALKKWLVGDKNEEQNKI